MGRRALPKIDPALDLSGVLRTLEQLPRPFVTTDEFGVDSSLEIEIGTGKGLFIAAAAGATPEHCFLGCEIAHKYARFAAARCVKRGLPNVRIVQGDAVRLMKEFLPDGVAAAVHVYFPDPWWKKRHHRRRMMQADNVREMERVLRPGGVLHFWTDVEEYFQLGVEAVRTATRLEGPLPVAEQAAEHDLDYRTHFERRTRLSSLPVFRGEFRKC